MIEEVHRHRNEPGVIKVLELIKWYRDQKIRALIASEAKRGTYIGAIRALDKVMRDITNGLRTIEKT
jgi:hypothetical protein